MACAICPVAGEKDQVTGKGLIFLHHDNVPNLQDMETVWLLRGYLCTTAYPGLEFVLRLYPVQCHSVLGYRPMWRLSVEMRFPWASMGHCRPEQLQGNRERTCRNDNTDNTLTRLSLVQTKKMSSCWLKGLRVK